jgi:putative transposase
VGLPAERRQVVTYLVATHGFSQRRACRLAQFRRAAMYYQARPNGQTVLRERLRTLAQERPRFSYRRLTVLRREFGAVNHKRVCRLYCAE